MKKQSFLILCLVSSLCFSSASLHAIKQKQFKSEEEANEYAIKHYNLGSKYYNDQEWRHAAKEFEKVIYFCPDSDEAAEAAYYLAVCYFEMKEYDFANREFSNYLKASPHPAFFEDAVYYKFCIAEHFKAGKKKRPFEMRYLPKWVSAHELALTIYDEVVAALPNHELTIQALYSKAELLSQMREYRDCIETYQTIIRRFPKNEIVPICYLNIAETYFQQSRYEFQNPDILALAELNLRKFKDEFPRDERIAQAEESVCRIKELYAKGLCDLGLFYERMKKPEAAAIYYQSSIEEFPDTRVAEFCYSRLACLGYADAAKEEEDSPAEESNACVKKEDISAQEECPSCANETNACIEEFNSCVNDANASKDKLDACVKKANACFETLAANQEDESGSENNQVFVRKAAPVEDISLPAEEPPYQEYYHYSVKKKRQASHTPFRPVDVYSEEDPENIYLEGSGPQPDVDDPAMDEDAPFMRHYSQLKHRDQKYVTPQE
jgi:outer membrane protein assembly factor BamD (BamD/ComL family)